MQAVLKAPTHPWYCARMRIFLLIAGFATCASVGAVDLWSLQRHALPEIILDAPDEATFVRRAGASLSRYSGRTGFEACGDICKAPDGSFGILPVSIGAHAACSTLRQCPKGMKLTGRLIHSHPTEARFMANPVDFYLQGKPYQANTWWTAGDPGVFSEADYVEPGYLVVYGQVWFQRGVGTEIRVGNLLTK
jgi:hypothetical protein